VSMFALKGGLGRFRLVDWTVGNEREKRVYFPYATEFVANKEHHF
jgi:hypothetical protein